MVSTVIPLPFPTSAFFAIAGMLDYPLRTFLIVVGLGRALRYGAIAAIASHYGRRFVVSLRHFLGGHSGLLLAIATAVIVAIIVVMVLRKRLQSSRPLVKTDPR